MNQESQEGDGGYPAFPAVDFLRHILKEQVLHREHFGNHEFMMTKVTQEPIGSHKNKQKWRDEETAEGQRQGGC